MCLYITRPFDGIPPESAAQTDRSKADNMFKKRWIRVLLGLVVVFGGLLLALPWIASSPPVLRILLAQADAFLAPAKFEVSSVSFSWFGPTRLTGFAFRDAQGDRVGYAPRGVWDRNFRQVLFEPLRLGTLRLEHAEIDAERLPDGTIDLIETLRPLFKRDPRTRLHIEIPDGRLRFRSPELNEPIVAERVQFALEKAPIPQPIAFTARLENGEPRAPRDVLAVEGEVNPWIANATRSADLNIRVTQSDWPWSATIGGISARGRLQGKATLAHEENLWTSTGNLAVVQLEATGAPLNGDTFQLDRLIALWDITQQPNEWRIRACDVSSSIVSLTGVSGEKTADGRSNGLQLTGQLNLAELASRLPRTLRIRDGVTIEKGAAELVVSLQTPETGAFVDVSAKVTELSVRDQNRSVVLREPATLTARLRRPTDLVELERLTATTPYLNAEARGNPATGVTLKADLDFAGLQQQLREVVDFGDLELAGQVAATGHYLVQKDGYRGTLDATLRSVKIKGAGPLAIERPSLVFRATVNGAATEAGLPSGWSALQSSLSSGDFVAELNALDAGKTLTAALRAPVALPDRPATFEARAEVQRKAGNLSFEPLVLTLAPADPTQAGAPPSIRLRARGRYNASEGSISILPVADDDRTGAIHLVDDGIQVTGLNNPGAWKLDGRVTGRLGAMRNWLPSAPAGLEGFWVARATARPVDDSIQLAAAADIRGLTVSTDPQGAGESVSLKGRANVSGDGERITLSQFSVANRFVSLDASGQVNDLSHNPSIDLKGTLAPDWSVINTWVATNIERQSRIGGRPRDWALRMSLGERWRESLTGEIGLRIDGADLYGLQLGRTELVVRARDGQVEIDPIDATLNRGGVHLEPVLLIDRTDGRGRSLSPAIRLGPESSVTNVEVNEEVSHRVLSYVSPALDRATRVRGKVSASLQDAIIPLNPDASRELRAEGTIVFQNVEFLPGGLFEKLLGIFALDDRPLSRLNDPVELAIADRRVYQRGQIVPVGKLVTVGIDGWVDFDRNVNLDTTVHFLPTLLTEVPVLRNFAGEAKLHLPIRGTLQKPEIDEEAFKLGMKQQGRAVIGRDIPQGLNDLFQLLRPRDRSRRRDR